MRDLAKSFQGPDAFRAEELDRPYTLLPFQFVALDDKRLLLSNLVGEHLVLPRAKVRQLILGELPRDSAEYAALLARHFVMEGNSTVAVDLLAAKYRTKQAVLSELTSLFMFIVTLRCEQSCRYCQVSRRGLHERAFDMTEKHADRAVDFMFGTPSRAIKVEFQGGEPLLNFDLVAHIVERVEATNRAENRDVSFVIATNLAPLTDDHLSFCAAHRVDISTSLDGPRDLHDANRPRPGNDSYARTVRGIERARAALGHDAVAGLMTTSPESLGRARDIVDEYAAQGFHSIFLRSMRPYGYATKDGLAEGYDVDRWLTFYREALGRILELNRKGVRIREEFASIILRKALTPWPTRYVDLQSPAGLGLSCVAFNYDGGIYACDEGRMLAEMGDTTFRLGHVDTDTFSTAIRSDKLLGILDSTMLEGVPMCSDCGFMPFCGADPVLHYKQTGDMVGFKPTSESCRRSMGVMRHLFTLLEDRPDDARILRSWST